MAASIIPTPYDLSTSRTRPSRAEYQKARRRLHALSRFFSYLSREEVILANFLRDVVSEWYDEAAPDEEGGERKRNPSMQEQARLVNGTAHPARRAFQACSAKWGCRPNEMLRLDRYTSLGLAMPEGFTAPPGFRYGFAQNPQALPFDPGGQVLYLPERMSPQGVKLPEKGRGKRWLVVDAELRPIFEQYLAWWDRHVKRDPTTGLPATTALWLTEHGTGAACDEKGRLPKDFSERWFYRDAQRLGLMAEGEREDPLRRWTGHAQRHFFEKVCEMAEVAGDWANHFRGDVFKDSRNRYYLPKPEEVQEKYLRWIPSFGFKALPEASRVRGTGVGKSETEAHRAILTAEAKRLRTTKKGYAWVRLARVSAAGETWSVPERVAGSVRYAVAAALPGQDVRVEVSGGRPTSAKAEELARALELACALLGRCPRHAGEGRRVRSGGGGSPRLSGGKAGRWRGRA